MPFLFFFIVRHGIKTMKGNEQAANYQDSGNSGYIISHLDFNFGHGSSYYPRRSSRTASSIYLTLPATATSVHISFIEFNIGNTTIDQCEAALLTQNQQDRLTIYNGLARTLYSCEGGATKPSDKTFQLNNNQLLIQFIIQPTGPDYKGVFMRYECKYESVLLIYWQSIEKTCVTTHQILNWSHKDKKYGDLLCWW